MTDPELIALVIVAVHCVLQLTDALAQRLVMRGQVELIRTVATAEAVVELSDTTLHGRTRRILVDRRANRGQA